MTDNQNRELLRYLALFAALIAVVVAVGWYVFRMQERRLYHEAYVAGCVVRLAKTPGNTLYGKEMIAFCRDEASTQGYLDTNR